MINSFKQKFNIQLVMKMLTFIMAAGVVIPMPFIEGSQYFWALLTLTIIYNIYLLILDLKEYIKLYFWEMLFIISCFVSAIINYQYNNIYSIVKPLITALIIFNMVTNKKNVTKDEINVEDNVINIYLLIFTFILGIISLGMFILNPVDILKGARFDGIYYNANQMGFWNFVSISISSFRLEKNKFFHTFNIIIQTLLLFLSGCRSAIISIVVFGIYLLSKKINNKKNVRKIIVAITCFSILFLVFITVIRYQWMFKAIEGYYLDYIINALTGMRYKLWKDAFHIFINKPIFGVGVDNIYNAASILLPQNSYIIIGNWEDAHNILITLLAYTGIVGTYIFIKLIYDKIKKSINNKLYNELIIVICLLIIALFDIGIVFDNRILSVYFWYVIGRINTYDYLKNIKR